MIYDELSLWGCSKMVYWVLRNPVFMHLLEHPFFFRQQNQRIIHASPVLVRAAEVGAQEAAILMTTRIVAKRATGKHGIEEAAAICDFRQHRIVLQRAWVYCLCSV